MATSKKSAPKGASPEGPSQQSIAIRAYGLFVQRGSMHGLDLDDWLQAERELRREDNQKPPKRGRVKAAKSAAK